MALFVCSLNSGSNGNCYYIGNEEEAILIDGGISCRETEKRLKRAGLSLKKVKAVFVSHEHGDHIHGIPALTKKHKLPVYITSGTLPNCKFTIAEDLIFTFNAKEPVRIGNLIIRGFPKLHDAHDPHSFIVSCKDVNVGIFTDIGSVCENVKHHFKQCHAAFLESNYDDHMLETGRYPYSLKNRIRGGKGHLSNVQAMRLFVDHRPSFMSHLFLSHLSRDNNSPELAKSKFDKVAGNTNIIVAPRDKETPVYHITPSGSYHPFQKRKRHQLPMQLSLFQ